MGRGWIRLGLCFVLVLNLVGCATSAKKEVSAQSEELGLKIKGLERQLQQKEEEIRSLEARLEEAKYSSEAATSQKPMVEISVATTENIQLALKNAGFYDGALDGKIGPKTKEAIKKFQEANGLKADGVVGKQTWAKLSKYLN